MRVANPRESSTWAGAVGAITTILSVIFPDNSDTIASIGAGVASLILGLLPNVIGGEKK